MSGIQRAVYRGLAYVVLPLVWMRLLWRSRKVPAYRQRMRERLFGVTRDAIQMPPGCIWIHAVSVGETIVALRLIEAIRDVNPKAPILLSTTTPTGGARARAGLPDDIHHVYMPYDFPWAVRRFLNTYQPRTVLMIEGEIWPELFWQLEARRVPLGIANARMSQRSYKRYQRYGWWMQDVWPTIACVASQSRADAARYIRLGVPRAQVKVLGNLKYDVALPATFAQDAQKLRQSLHPAITHVVVASSTHPGEDALVLAAFQALCQTMPQTVLCLVPRHIERASDILALVHRHGLTGVLRSQHGIAACQAGQVYVADTMGELPMFYGAADVCFVGGSLVPIGGHNPIEPALAHCPIVVGPYLFNFTDMFRMLRQQQACLVVRTPDALAQAWQHSLTQPSGQDMAARAYQAMVHAQGVLARYVVCFKPWLFDAKIGAAATPQPVCQKGS